MLTYGGGEYEGAVPERRRLPARLRVLLFVLVLGGGGYYFLLGSDSALAPRVGAPDATLARLPAVGGGAMLGAATATDTTVAPGSPVEISARATGADGAVLSDVRVRFTVDRGGGNLAADEVWTDRGGIARTTVLTPNRPASVLVRASLDGQEAPSTHFTIVTRVGAAAALRAVRGDDQVQDAGGLLPERLGVRVTDAAGLPVPGVEVRFEVGSGGGLSAPSVARTDSLGQASAIWRLGSAPGRQLLTASAPSMGARVVFTATARGDVQEASEVAAVEGPAAAPGSAPPATVVARNLAVGGSNVCLLAGSTVTCRGANDRGQGIRGAVRGARSVAAGLFHGCAVDGSGTAYCWGANEAGQLGDGSRSDRASAVPVATDWRFAVLAAGLGHTCGIIGDGRAACWGQNLGGQLGDGSRNDRAMPGLVADATRFVDLSAGWDHTCGITPGRDLYCWGLNREGAVGDGSQLDRLAPQRIAGSVTGVAAGSAHTCAISEGRVLCWGDNRSGQLGDGTNTARPRPTPVVDLPGAPVALAAGAAHTCALLDGGAVYCWGQNLHGQLGHGGIIGTRRPSPVVGGHTFTRLSAGGGVTCGSTSSGEVYCWGLNQNGQLGDGTFSNRTVPSLVAGG